MWVYTLSLFFSDTGTTEIYTSGHTLALHYARPCFHVRRPCGVWSAGSAATEGHRRSRSRSTATATATAVGRAYVHDMLLAPRPRCPGSTTAIGTSRYAIPTISAMPRDAIEIQALKSDSFEIGRAHV